MILAYCLVYFGSNLTDKKIKRRQGAAQVSEAKRQVALMAAKLDQAKADADSASIILAGPVRHARTSGLRPHQCSRVLHPPRAQSLSLETPWPQYSHPRCVLVSILVNPQRPATARP